MGADRWHVLFSTARSRLAQLGLSSYNPFSSRPLIRGSDHRRELEISSQCGHAIPPAGEWRRLLRFTTSILGFWSREKDVEMRK